MAGIPPPSLSKLLLPQLSAASLETSKTHLANLRLSMELSGHTQWVLDPHLSSGLLAGIRWFSRFCI